MLTVEEKLQAYVALVEDLELQLAAHRPQTHVVATHQAIDAMLERIHTSTHTIHAAEQAPDSPGAGIVVDTGGAQTPEQAPQVDQTTQMPSGEGSETPTA